MKNILVLGASGMLGSMVTKVLSENENFNVSATFRPYNGYYDYNIYSNRFSNIDYYIFTDVYDILKHIETKDKLFFSEMNFDYVINCIGVTKPYIKNEKDKENAIYINSIFPIELNKLSEKYRFKVIQIATDCVFDGKDGNYTETSDHNANDVYGKTKSLGEIESDSFLNLRCSIIGPEIFHKTFLLEWILGLENGSKIQGYNNHLWNGITTYHFAKIVEGIIEKDKWFSGTQHIVPLDTNNKLCLLKDIAKIFEKDIIIQTISHKKNMNMILNTNDKARNKELWSNIDCDRQLTIKEMLMDLKEYML